MQGLSRAEAFRRMHERTTPDEPLILPNVWDAVSARAFADAGFSALATSSGAVAAVLGYEDGGYTPADEMFAAVARIVRSVDVPVTADIEHGYGLPPVEIVERLLAAGAVGCNLEDSDPAAQQLKDARKHAEWLAEVVAAADGRLVVNARIDTFLFGDRSVAATVERALLYAEAGADAVFPILAPPSLLPDITGGVPCPVNALCLPDGPAPGELGRLGARRITFGRSLHRRSVDALLTIAGEVPRAGA